MTSTKSSFEMGPVRYQPGLMSLPAATEGRWTVTAQLPVSILIKASQNLLDPANLDLLSFGPPGRRFAAVDSKVHALYADRIQAYFDAHGVEVHLEPVVCTENTKDTDSLFQVLEAMERFNLSRTGEVVLGIGGGVLLDIVGLAATMYRRGVPYLRIPTTLLALVDASVGVKTGVNYLGRRNRLGSYYGPVAAYLDRSFLKTLPHEELVVGMGEIIKMAVVKDLRLFELCEQHAPRLVQERFQGGEGAAEIVNRSIQGMVEELEPNLWEKDMKRLVNFGHSFSPIIEMRTEGALAHGEAVALDVLYSCVFSNLRNLLPTEQMERVFALCKAVGLPTWHPYFGDMEMMVESRDDTTRHRNGSLDLPIPVTLGHSIFLNDITLDEMKTTSERMEELSRRVG